MTQQETYSAKQVARRIGTDAKTFRKWLRSTASPYDAVGQGKRYEFPVAELGEIKKQFNLWKNRRPGGALPKINGTVSTKVTTTPIPTQPDIIDALDEKEREPTPEELEDLELDLDLEDL